MGGETEAQVSPWTVDSLKEHFETRINALEDRLDERHQAQKEAILKSETAAERRFESVNEFRGQLNDQVKTFITRDTYDVGHSALETKVAVVENLITGMIAEKRGAGDQTKAIYALAGFVSVVLVIGTILAANGVFG